MVSSSPPESTQTLKIETPKPQAPASCWGWSSRCCHQLGSRGTAFVRRVLALWVHYRYQPRSPGPQPNPAAPNQTKPNPRSPEPNQTKPPQPQPQPKPRSPRHHQIPTAATDAPGQGQKGPERPALRGGVSSEHRLSQRPLPGLWCFSGFDLIFRLPAAAAPARGSSAGLPQRGGHGRARGS